MRVSNVTADATTFTANAYLIEGVANTLVDVGSMTGVTDVLSETVDRVDGVVITHAHYDHIGQLEAVIERFDPQVYAASDAIDTAIRISDGDTVPAGDRQLQVMYTPGHADDHVVLFDDAVLFSGDIVVYSDGAYDDGSYGKTDGPGPARERLIESLERLQEELPETVDTLYPGHGPNFTGDVHGVIERALKRARRREPKYPDE